MLLSEQMVKEGGWLFRWRSFLPIFLFVGELVYLQQYQYLGDSEIWDNVWTVISLCLSLLGVWVRMLTVGSAPRRTSGRNRHHQVADELNTTGMYSLMRNPLYFGNALIWLGMALFTHSITFFLTVLLICWVYHERIIAAEESFLSGKFGDAYRAWAAQTPVFIPQSRGWKAPKLTFSFKRALRREYLGLFGVVTGFTLLKAAAESYMHQTPSLGQGWMIFWAVSFILFLGVRVLSKATKLLSNPEETRTEPRPNS